MAGQGNVPLQIQFIDEPGELVVGEKVRFRVLKQGAIGQGQNIEIDQLDFLFKPIVWGQVEMTEDPYVGLLRIVELIENPDVYATPDYAISAVLKASGGTVLKPKRRSRLAPRRIELELLFLYGYPGAFERYDPLKAKRPLDPESAFRIDSENARVRVRDGRIYLVCESLADLFNRVECRLPSGDVASLDLVTLIDSGAAWKPTEPSLYPVYEQRLVQQGPYPRMAPPVTGDEGPAPVAEPPLGGPYRLSLDPPKPIDAVDLEVDFLDPPGDLIPGEEIRFRVRLDDTVLDLRHLRFNFQPFVWATAEATADPKVDRLRVQELPRNEDIYRRSDYLFEAHLRARGACVLSACGHPPRDSESKGDDIRPRHARNGTRRLVRIIPGQVEVELVFFRGHTGSHELFDPLNQPRPMDPQQAFRLTSDRQRVVVNDGRIYLQCDRLSELKTNIACTLPNGENLNLDLGSRIESGTAWQASEIGAYAESRALARPVLPEPSTQDAPEERALRERIRQLRNFVQSFQSRRGKPDPKTTEMIRQRISARIKLTREHLEQYHGDRQQEFLLIFQRAIDSIPDYLRIQSLADAAASEEGLA